MTQRPQMEQWCARAGLWLSHLVHMRVHPAGIVGRLFDGVAPGLESMARACDARARAAKVQKTMKCATPMPGESAHHGPSVTVPTAHVQ